MEKELNRYQILILTLYACLITMGVLIHEPWRDEGQAWLITRDLSIPDILRQMGYEGTPALWHLILTPFAKLGFPYLTMHIVHVVIAVATVFVFVKYAPFPTSIKALFIFSYFMAYEYAVVARNYDIGILMLFLIAAFYDRRFQKPVLFATLVLLLYNSNALVFFPALAITILFALELRKNVRPQTMHYAAISIMVLAALMAYLQMRPAADNGARPIVNYVGMFVAISNTFIPCNSSLWVKIGASLFFTVFLLTQAIYLVKKPAGLFLFFMSYVGLLFVFTYRTLGFMRHYGFILVFLLFILWIYNTHKRTFTYTALTVSLIISVSVAARTYYDEFQYNFSGGKDMANFIIHGGYTKHTIIAYQGPNATSILPYLPAIKLWYPETQGFHTFFITNQILVSNMYLSTDEVLRRARNNFSDMSKTLFLLTYPLENAEALNLTLVHSSHNKPFWCRWDNHESYWLYKTNDTPLKNTY
ncbi:MAG: hypothetical protein HQL06_10375 [Nitrospirae bacterium]|nr:hypothetical protein [Nitrospirota bacterium]